MLLNKKVDNASTSRERRRCWASCKTSLSRRKVCDAIKKEIAKEKQELTPYSFWHRYAYYGHNRPKADGSYVAPIQVADAIGKTLDTHLLSYSWFQAKDLAGAFDETTLLVKAADWFSSETFY